MTDMEALGTFIGNAMARIDTSIELLTAILNKLTSEGGITVQCNCNCGGGGMEAGESTHETIITNAVYEQVIAPLKLDLGISVLMIPNQQFAEDEKYIYGGFWQREEDNHSLYWQNMWASGGDVKDKEWLPTQINRRTAYNWQAPDGTPYIVCVGEHVSYATRIHATFMTNEGYTSDRTKWTRSIEMIPQLISKDEYGISFYEATNVIEGVVPDYFQKPSGESEWAPMSQYKNKYIMNKQGSALVVENLETNSLWIDGKWVPIES